MSLFDKTISSLERSLDYAALKNRTIANNIANVDTPNYKAKDVVFKDVLQNSIDTSFEAKRTRPKHIPFTSTKTLTPYQVMARQGTSYNHNGNNVDIDKEMTSLAENQIYYQALIDRLNGKFRNIETVLKGGR